MLCVSQYTSLLQIYSATFSPNIIEISQHLSYCEKQKGELFFETQCSFVYQFSVVWSVYKFIERDCFIGQRVVQNVMWVTISRITASK